MGSELGQWSASLSCTLVTVAICHKISLSKILPNSPKNSLCDANMLTERLENPLVYRWGGLILKAKKTLRVEYRLGAGGADAGVY